MTAFVKNGQLQKSVRNILGPAQSALKAFHGLIRPKDHAVTLSREVQEVGPLRAQRDEAIQHRFRPADFEARAQRAAGVHEGDQVLRMFAGGLFEELQCFIEAMALPEGAGFLQLRQIDAETRDDDRACRSRTTGRVLTAHHNTLRERPAGWEVPCCF
jgi:hypothetical protein